MKLHLFQYDIAWEDPAKNFQTIDRMASAAGIDEGDLVLLPEMFATGFSLNTDTTKDHDAAQLGYLQSLAEDLGAFVVGGRTVRPCDCAKASNLSSVISPDGTLLGEYAKVHPFTYGRETERFAGGTEVVTLPVHPFTLCPTVCYDLRFPELFRKGLAKGADLFTVIANWPEPRQAHWRALLIARAIENQAFVAGVNRCGSDPHLPYAGGSMVVGPKGEILGELGREPGVLSAEFDPETLRAWRAEFPAWTDQRLTDRPATAPNENPASAE